MNTVSEELENRRKKLLWRACHRGMKEMDLMIGGYASEKLPDMSAEQLSEFEAIISVSDAQLSDWLTDKTPTPDKFQTTMFAEIKAQRFDTGDYKKL